MMCMMLSLPILAAEISTAAATAPVATYSMWLILFIIFLALAFDFINGFHDAANSVATVVSTRVLSPAQAVLWAAFFNFVAFAIFSTHVAGSIAKGIDGDVVTLGLVGAGLVGAIVWDLITWWRAL